MRGRYIVRWRTKKIHGRKNRKTKNAVRKCIQTKEIRTKNVRSKICGQKKCGRKISDEEISVEKSPWNRCQLWDHVPQTWPSTMMSIPGAAAVWLYPKWAALIGWGAYYQQMLAGDRLTAIPLNIDSPAMIVTVLTRKKIYNLLYLLFKWDF